MKPQFSIKIVPVLILLFMAGCSTAPSGNAAYGITKEKVKEIPGSAIAEYKVPRAVIDSFARLHPNTPRHKWCIIKGSTDRDTSEIIIPKYQVVFREDNQQFKSTYSPDGKRMQILRRIDLEIVPNYGVNFIITHYEGWKTVSVYEKLDTSNSLMSGFIITVKKDNKKEKVFMDINGSVQKIQILS